MDRSPAGIVRCLMLARLLLFGMFIGACSASSASPRGPSTPPPIVTGPDVVIRRETDGKTGFAVKVALGAEVAFGLGLQPGEVFEAVATSPNRHIAEARAWQSLARRLADDPGRSFEAARRGNPLLAPCANEIPGGPRQEIQADDVTYAVLTLSVTERLLVRRLTCNAKDGLDAWVVNDGDLAIRRDARGGLSILARVRLGEIHAAGWARTLDTAIERSPSSPAANLARSRAWRAAVSLADDQELAYDAARRGVAAATGCPARHSRDRLRRAELAYREGRLDEAVREATELLDATLALCAWKYRDQVR